MELLVGKCKYSSREYIDLLFIDEYGYFYWTMSNDKQQVRYNPSDLEELQQNTAFTTVIWEDIVRFR